MAGMGALKQGLRLMHLEARVKEMERRVETLERMFVGWELYMNSVLSDTGIEVSE
jgi:hypothetical protein